MTDLSEATEAAALGRRNDRILLWAVAAYIVVLSALMLVRGVSITPDVLLVAFGLAAVLLGRGRLFLRDWIPFIGLFFAYELMRGYADNLGIAVHVTDVLAIERLLFFGSVPTQVLQDALHPATGSDVLASAATVFYFLHFPLPIAVGVLPVAPSPARLLRLRRRADPAGDGRLRHVRPAAGRAAVVGGRARLSQRTGRRAGDRLPQGAGVRPAGPVLRLRGPLSVQLHDLRHQPEPGRGLPVAPRRLPVPRLPVRATGVRPGRLDPARVLGLRLVRRSSTWPTTTSSTSSAGCSTRRPPTGWSSTPRPGSAG